MYKSFDFECQVKCRILSYSILNTIMTFKEYWRNYELLTEDEIYKLTKNMTEEELLIFMEKYYRIPKTGWVKLNLDEMRKLSPEEEREMFHIKL